MLGDRVGEIPCALTPRARAAYHRVSMDDGDHDDVEVTRGEALRLLIWHAATFFVAALLVAVYEGDAPLRWRPEAWTVAGILQPITVAVATAVTYPVTALPFFAGDYCSKKYGSKYAKATALMVMFCLMLPLATLCVACGWTSYIAAAATYAAVFSVNTIQPKK